MLAGHPHGRHCFSFMTFGKLYPHSRDRGELEHADKWAHRACLPTLTPNPRGGLQLVKNQLPHFEGPGLLILIISYLYLGKMGYHLGFGPLVIGTDKEPLCPKSP